MSEVIAEVDRRRPGADRRGQRAQPGQGDRQPRAGRLRRRLRRRGGRQAAAGRCCHSPTFRPYTSTDVRRLRARRRLQERRRLAVGMAVGLGFGDNTTASVITRGLAETARLGDGARRRPADADGPRRARRPGRHLLLAAVAQPHVRREARPGHDHRGDRRLHPPGRRGREVVRVAARAGPARTASTRRSPSTSTPWSRGEMTAAGHDGRASSPRDTKAETRLTAGAAPVRTSRARSRSRPTVQSTQRRAPARSSHRSSTSSMPTDSRTRPSGMVAGSVFQRRRRSNVDSTPPRLVACTHSRGLAGEQVGGHRALGEHDRRRSRRSRGSGPRRPPGAPPSRRTSSWALACARSTRRCRVRRPRSASQASKVPGHRADAGRGGP